MIYKILILLAATFGLIQFFRTENTSSRAIVAIQITAIAISFAPFESAMLVGMLIFLVSIIGIGVYAVVSDIAIIKRRLLFVSAILAIVVHLFSILHFPGAGVLGFLMFVPVIAMVYLIAFTRDNRAELGFMTIFTMDSFIEILLRIPW